MPEAPLYRIYKPTEIRGKFIGPDKLQYGPVEMTIPGEKPRNSWEPLNEAAREAFKRRDALALAKKDAEIAGVEKQMAEVKAAGAGEAELAGFHVILSRLRLERAEMPKALKAVPTFGGASPTHSLAFDVEQPDKPEVRQVEDDPKLERIVSALIAGGASDADVAEARAAFKLRAEMTAPPAIVEHAEVKAKEEKPAGKQKRASDS